MNRKIAYSGREMVLRNAYNGARDLVRAAIPVIDVTPIPRAYNNMQLPGPIGKGSSSLWSKILKGLGITAAAGTTAALAIPNQDKKQQAVKVPVVAPINSGNEKEATRETEEERPAYYSGSPNARYGEDPESYFNSLEATNAEPQGDPQVETSPANTAGNPNEGNNEATYDTFTGLSPYNQNALAIGLGAGGTAIVGTMIYKKLKEKEEEEERRRKIMSA